MQNSLLPTLYYCSLSSLGSFYVPSIQSLVHLMYASVHILTRNASLYRMEMSNICWKERGTCISASMANLGVYVHVCNVVYIQSLRSSFAYHLDTKMARYSDYFFIYPF
jgi:hypothetical protein